MTMTDATTPESYTERLQREARERKARFAAMKPPKPKAAPIAATPVKAAATPIADPVPIVTRSVVELNAAASADAAAQDDRPAVALRPSIGQIIKHCADDYGIRAHDLISERRTDNIVRPRQVAMYLAKTMTLRSFPYIGRRMGGRDHTTVLHAVRKIEARVTATSDLFDADLAERVLRIRDSIQASMDGATTEAEISNATE